MNGGAIAFDYFPPVTDTNTFSGNNAPYGSDIGAYQFKVQQAMSFDYEFVTGQKITRPLEFELVDGYGNVIMTDPESVLTMEAISDGIVTGTSDVSVINGMATFDDITFIS